MMRIHRLNNTHTHTHSVDGPPRAAFCMRLHENTKKKLNIPTVDHMLQPTCTRQIRTKLLLVGAVVCVWWAIASASTTSEH